MSAVGAIVLAGSVFLPWYRVGAPAHGLAAGGPAGAAPAGSVGGLHASPGLAAVLLALAALAMLDVLLPLVRARGPVPVGAGGAVVLLGALGAACAAFRMVDPPSSVTAAGMLAASLREGAWLALIGSVTVMLGGMWPRCVPAGELGALRPGTLSWN
ncbi:MAG TPA: hypothetical protein VGY13_04025 [Solirubrobacteraceae bacterium]|nr:hypothetical protein [Solirubrobacteraceae bacterium]